jgi:hypothetical protein
MAWVPPGPLRELAGRLGGLVLVGRTAFGAEAMKRRRRVLITVVDDVEVRLAFGRQSRPLIHAAWVNDEAPPLASYRLPEDEGEVAVPRDRVRVDRRGLRLELERVGKLVTVAELEHAVRWLARAANPVARELSFLRSLPGAVPNVPDEASLYWSFHEPEFASGYSAHVTLPTVPPIWARPIVGEPEALHLKAANGADVVVPPPLDAARTLAAAEALARSVGGNPLAAASPDAASWVLLRGFTRVL